MRTIREGAGELINKKNAQNLYSKYMILALEAQKKRGDRVLFESYYQRAEYYLHLMNELTDGLSVTPTRLVKLAQQDTVLPLLFKESFLRRNQPRRRSRQKCLDSVRKITPNFLSLEFQK